MKRRLLTILSALSLVLCISFVVLWIRSTSVQECIRGHWQEYNFDKGGDETAVNIGSANHSLLLSWERERLGPGIFDVDQGNGFYCRYIPDFAGTVVQNMENEQLIFCPAPIPGGFEFSLGIPGSPWDGRTYSTIGLPYWFLVALAAILPIRRLVVVRRNRLIAVVGLCRVCGYDLRASPERCPECGTPVPSPASAPRPTP